MVKADAACITWPSVMLPSRNFGAASSSGTTGAIRFGPLRHDRGSHMLSGEQRPLLEDRTKGSLKSGALFFFATEQRNAFAILANACERIAIFGFRLVAAFRN